MAVRVLLCGGATAGHIEPALNIAHELSARGADCEFVGTTRGLDQQLIGASGYPLHMITPVPMPRSMSLNLMLFPMHLIQAIAQSVRICRTIRPDVIIGFGSFVALPVYIVAWMMKLPLIIHEANAKPGIANKVGAGIATRKFQTVKDSLRGAETVGTPLRKIYDDFDRVALRQQGVDEFQLDPRRATLLVFGGSQGARRINEVVNNLSETLTSKDIQIVHVVGKNNTDQMFRRKHHHYREYVSDMTLAYAVADAALCRSGALSVAEISATNTPAIFVPFPTGNGEQEKNAQNRVAAGAARMILDKDLTPSLLLEEINFVLSHLEAMKQTGEQQKPINATQIIVNSILEVAEK